MLVAMAAMMAMQFSSTEVGFNGADGFELKGTFLAPVGKQNFPAVLLLPGSGPTDRDGNTPLLTEKVDNLKQIAESLSSVGIASLRFDKRAIHTYSPSWPKDMNEIPKFFSWNNFVTDAKDAFDYMKTLPGVDAKRAGVLGHSEGALIALRVACDSSEDVHALIMLDGQGRSLDKVLMQQLNEKLPGQLAHAGMSAQLPTYLDYAKKACDQLKKEAAVPPNPPGGLAGLFNFSTLLFLHQNFQDDPSALAATYRGDVLVMNGELDNQVSPVLDAKALHEVFNKRSVGDVKLVIVPGASHELKATPDRDTDGMYGPVLPSALKDIDEWCMKHL